MALNILCNLWTSFNIINKEGQVRLISVPMGEQVKEKMIKCFKFVFISATIVIIWVGFIFAQGPNTFWTKTYGGGGNEVGYSVLQNCDEGFVIAGYTESFGAGLSDVYLIRTDSNGDTLWTKTYGGMEGDEGWSVQETFDGGYIIVGGTQSFGSGNWDIYLIRTEPEGVGIEENGYPRELFYITCCEPNPFST